MTVQRVKKAKHQPATAEIISDDEQPETPVSTKKPPPPPVIGEYLLTVRTYVSIQTVYRESQSTIEGHWSARRYFDESKKKVETTANERGIEPVLESSTATIYSKSMKPADYVTNDVNEPKDWYNVESVVNHLAKSLSKGIRVDLVIKYRAKRLVKEFEDEEEMDVMEIAEEEAPLAKRPRQVICAYYRLLTL